MTEFDWNTLFSDITIPAIHYFDGGYCWIIDLSYKITELQDMWCHSTFLF